jgi:outer membrane murein-binding lipoprotein Lpp
MGYHQGRRLTMRTVVCLALCALLIAGCGSGKGKSIDELKTQVDELNRRVKSLEDDLLKANKQLIQQKQAMQLLHEEMKNIDNYFNKVQAGQSALSH